MGCRARDDLEITFILKASERTDNIAPVYDVKSVFNLLVQFKIKLGQVGKMKMLFLILESSQGFVQRNQIH